MSFFSWFVSGSLLALALGLAKTNVGCLARPFTMSFNSLPARKAGTLAAAIFNGANVLGLRPVRALRLRRSNVPKPTRVTLSPWLKQM